MAVLDGYTPGVQFVPGPPGAPQNPSGPSTGIPAVVDGTPVRVVVLAMSAAAGIIALRMAGFRFNVGVSA